MNKHNQRLVLECVVLATEIVRLANELITLLNMAINYHHHYESKMGFKI